MSKGMTKANLSRKHKMLSSILQEMVNWDVAERGDADDPSEGQNATSKTQDSVSLELGNCL